MSLMHDEDACFNYIQSIPGRGGAMSEFFTKRTTVEEMLNMLPRSIWSDAQATWMDPAAGTGVFVACVYFRLMRSLQSIPKQSRSQHIIRKMLFMNDIDARNVSSMRKIFGNNANITQYDAVVDSRLRDKYTIVMCNPPFSIPSANYQTLYHMFVELFIDKCRVLLLLIPSTWFTSARPCLVKMRTDLQGRFDIAKISTFTYYQSQSLFSVPVKVEFGVQYFLKDANHKGRCVLNGKQTRLDEFDIIPLKAVPKSLIQKVTDLESVNSLITSFHIETNDTRLRKSRKPHWVPCHMINGTVEYIHEDEVNAIPGYSDYKVLSPRALHVRVAHFSDVKIIRPYEVCTHSFICFKCSSKAHAINLASYFQTKFTVAMLECRMSSRTVSHSSFNWIPNPPITKLKWTDAHVSEWLDLSDKEQIVFT
jgi:hypothetical protein